MDKNPLADNVDTYGPVAGHFGPASNIYHIGLVSRFDTADQRSGNVAKRDSCWEDYVELYQWPHAPVANHSCADSDGIS